MLLPHEVKQLYTENLTRSWHFSGKRSTDLRLEYDNSIVPSMDRDRLQLQYKVTNMLNKPPANKEGSICTVLEPFTCRKHLVKKKKSNELHCLGLVRFIQELKIESGNACYHSVHHLSSSCWHLKT